MKRFYTIVLLLIWSLAALPAMAQLSGVLYVGNDGTAPGGDDPEFPTLRAAFDALSDQGNDGDVTFLITSDITEAENIALGFDPGEDHSVTVKPAPGAQPTLRFTSTEANRIYSGGLILGLDGIDGGSGDLTFTRNIHFDGSNTDGGTTRDLTIEMAEEALTSNSFRLIGTTENVQIRNLNLVMKQNTGNAWDALQITTRNDAYHAGLVIENNHIENLAATSARAVNFDAIGTVETPPSAVVRDNHLVASRYGVWLRAAGGSIEISGNTIEMDHTAGFFAYGILVEELFDENQRVTIAENHIHGTSNNTLLAIAGDATGAYAISGNHIGPIVSEDGISRGVRVRSGGEYHIDGNVFADFDGAGGVRMIEVANNLEEDHLVVITNNFMTGFASTDGDGERLDGIYVASPVGAIGDVRAYHNTLVMNALDVSGTGWEYFGLSMFSSSRLRLDLKNNILMNLDDNAGVTSKLYRQVGSTLADMSSDNNLWFVASPSADDNTFLSRHGDVEDRALTLAEHQAASGHDGASVSKDVSFVDLAGADLRLVPPSDGDGDLAGAVLLDGEGNRLVPMDIDGTLRNEELPYIGAFEGSFLGVVPARVQIVHNAADPAAAAVDIYVNGDLFVPELGFREATPFVDVPAEVGLLVEIFGHGADPQDVDPVFSADGVEFSEGGTYAVIANGVLGEEFAENPDDLSIAFGLNVLPARESNMVIRQEFRPADGSLGDVTGQVAFYVWHGATDAPAVDIEARDVATLAEGLAYSASTDYLEVPAADYTVDLSPAGSGEVIASFLAPLSEAAGQALGVLASGFLDPEANSDGEAFGLLAVFADGTTLMLPAADLPEPDEPALARAQIVHNAADPAAAAVDIYVNGDLFVDSLAFRAATPFVDVPAEVGLLVEIFAHGADPLEDDAVFSNDGVEFSEGGTYAVIANGVLGEEFAENPDELSIAFGLNVLPARESHVATGDVLGGGAAGEAAGEVAFYIWHGATDAPAVDVVARDVTTLAEGLAYSATTGYLEVPAADYTVDLSPAGSGEVIASFLAPLSEAAGQALGVLASGFLDPEVNSDGEAFGLLAVFADGSTLMLPAADLPEPDEPALARAQIVHNAADPAAAAVDIYVNGDLFVDSLAFRAATPFVDVPAEVGLLVEIFVHGADPLEDDAVFSNDGVEFSEGGTYAVIANGVLGEEFAENPDDLSIAFGLNVLPARESHVATGDVLGDGAAGEAAGEVAFYIWHGATDAPAVDVVARDVTTLAEGLAYSATTGYLEVPAADYTVDLSPAGSGEVIASFLAPLSEAGGQALGVLASGFLNPAANSDGEAFGLLAVFADGTTVLLPTAATSAEPLAERPADFRLDQNFPNPFNPSTQISFTLPETSQVTLEVYNVQGQRLAVLVDGTREAGVHNVTFDAANLASGVYLYRIQAGSFVQTNKMMLVK